MGLWIGNSMHLELYVPSLAAVPEKAQTEILADTYVVEMLLRRVVASEIQNLRTPRPGATGKWVTVPTARIATDLLIHALNLLGEEDREKAVSRITDSLVGNRSDALPPEIEVFKEDGVELELSPGAWATGALPLNVDLYE